MTYLATNASVALMWISIIYMIGLAGSLLFGLKGGPNAIAGMMVILAMCVRICWIVTVPIVFHRLNEAMDSAQNNLDILDTQQQFVSYAQSCGNPIYAMNMNQAR